MPITQRFSIWLDAKLNEPGKSGADLARKLTLAPDKVTKMRKGVRRPTATEMPVIEDYIGELSPDSVRMRAGRSAIEESGLPEEEGSLYQEGGKATLSSGAIAEMDLRGGAGGGGYPIPTQATDGRFSYAAEVVRAEWILPQSYLREELRVQLGFSELITIEGGSMEPELHSGDRVLVNRLDTNILNGGIFAVREGEGVIVKHVELIRNTEPPRIRCKSSNQNYDPFELILDGSNDIIGRVVWRGTRM